MRRGRLFLAAVLAVALIGAACAPSTSSRAYNRGTAQRSYSVFEGTVLSVNEVQIEGTRSGLGAAIGAVAGGVVGSTIGRGHGTTLATVGGALAGGAAGAAAEEGLTKEPGLEIVVKLDNGESIGVAQKADVPFSVGERVRVLRYADGNTRVTKY